MSNFGPGDVIVDLHGQKKLVVFAGAKYGALTMYVIRQAHEIHIVEETEIDRTCQALPSPWMYRT